MEKEDVIKHLNRKVIYDGSVYMLWKYEAWRDGSTQKLDHALVLIDKNKNSTVHVPIEKVEVMSDEDDIRG